MPDSMTTPEATEGQGRERPLIRARYNEPFSISVPDALSEFHPVKGSHEARDLSHQKSMVFDVEIGGHPGYPKSVTRNQIMTNEIATTIVGRIVVIPNFQLLGDTFSYSQGGMKRERRYFSPYGPLTTIGIIEIDEKGELKFGGEKAPVTIRITLSDIWKGTQGQDPTRVFLIAHGQAVESFPYPFRRPDHESFVVEGNSWDRAGNRSKDDLEDIGIFLQGKLPGDAFIEKHQVGKMLLLPGDSEFWQSAKFVIGDKSPVQ